MAAFGQTPRCALDESDSAAIWLNQIVELITEAISTVHGLSRVGLNSSSGLLRFNMPLELGADLSLRLRGPARHRRRRILVLDATPHGYDQTLSDSSGMDIAAHGNGSDGVIGAMRDCLNTGREDAPPLPGSVAIVADYAALQIVAEGIIARARLDPFEMLAHLDFLYVVEAALPKIEAARKR